MLEKDYKETCKLLEELLKLIREPIPITVVSYLLISLSHLSIMEIDKAKTAVQFQDRMADFVNHWTDLDEEGEIINLLLI